jgi:transcriptional regulator with XRE-family HTH domain
MTPETQHMLDVLRSAIRALGYSYNEVGVKLGVSNGYLSRLFSGKIDLKFDHIVEISRALGFEPEEMLHLAYPQAKTPPSQSAARYQELMGGAGSANRTARPQPPPDLPSAPEEMDALVAQSLQRLLAAPAPPRPAATTEEDVERIVERMLRKFFGNLARAEAQGE